VRFKSTLAIFALAALAVFTTLAMAQQSDSKDKTGPMPGGPMPGGPMPGMMSGGMMMNQMMTQHQEMTDLMNKMMQSMKAINDEKNPANLRALLKEHDDLMDQMRAKMTGEGKMMHNMAPQMKNCPMMAGETGKSSSK
jgi:hypothetical protein